jgi:hypothetical protein
MHLLVTGSSGLIGDESVAHSDAPGCRVTGVVGDLSKSRR